MARYKIKGTRKLKDKIPFLVPHNQMQCIHCLVGPGEEVDVEIPENVDLRAGYGTVAILEKKGFLEVLEESDVVKEEEAPLEEANESVVLEEWVCEECNKSFSSERGLHSHMRVHKDDDEEGEED